MIQNWEVLVACKNKETREILKSILADVDESLSALTERVKHISELVQEAEDGATAIEQRLKAERIAVAEAKLEEAASNFMKEESVLRQFRREALWNLEKQETVLAAVEDEQTKKNIELNAFSDAFLKVYGQKKEPSAT